ncbi:MAG: metallophosphoesterase [Planctomycetales bacterium]|nr:metallophosphoesterase [Planctomycetales bacterium]
MLLLEIAILLLAAFGHSIVWIGALNRIHSLGAPRWVVEALSLPCRLAFVVLPFLVTSQYVRTHRLHFEGAASMLTAYLMIAALVALVVLLIEVLREVDRWRQPRILLSHKISVAKVDRTLKTRPVGARLAAVLSRVPGNQIFDIHIEEKEIAVPHLDPRHDGLRIAHLTDFHMSGRITRPFFEEVVRLTNAARPDLVLITGDLFDSPECIDWIGATLGKLRARDGVYFILGNHDRRVDEEHARQALVAAGLVDLGGHFKPVSIQGRPVLLAGNELPWFTPAADVDRFDDDPHAPALRVLLAHTPDQIEWAQAKGFQLMLAGHTHGGQFKLPLLGAVLAPSRMGTRYASGVFWESPTVMHVSRGISSLLPIRINCPPELAILTLRPLVIKRQSREKEAEQQTVLATAN